MKRILIILFLAQRTIILHSQGPDLAWVNKIGGTLPDLGTSIATDMSGNVYSTGFFSGTADFDPGPGIFNLFAAGESDIFISKLDAYGNFIWAKQVAGTTASAWGKAYSITLDQIGNVFIAGNFFGAMDFDVGPGILQLTSLSSNTWPEIFILKLEQSGNFQWAKQIGGAGGFGSFASSIAADIYGNVYTTGLLSGIVDFDPGPGVFNLNTVAAGSQAIFILKLDTYGNFTWAKQLGGTSYNGIGRSLALDGPGNIYITGNFSSSGPLDFDPGPSTYNLSPVGIADIFVCKLNTSGNLVWAGQMGGIEGEESFSLVLGDQYNIFITGYFTGTADFDPGSGVFNLTATASSNMFVSKIDASGNFIFAKQAEGTGSSIGHALAVDILDNIYITGEFSRTVDFDPGPAVQNFTTIGINGDMFVLKLNTSGNLSWAKHIGGGSASYACGRAIDIDNFGDIYTTGEFQDNVDFDPSVGVFNLTSDGSTDIFVHKMGDTTIITTYINTYTPVLGFEPCTSKITVEDASTFNTGDTVLLIQMKGAVIDSSNAPAFGTITDYKNAGNYEFNYIKSKTGNIIELKNKFARQYDIPDGKVQLVRVPYYQNLNVTSTLTCLPWDGSKGGVLVLNVRDTITLNADIDISGKGFKGGAAYPSGQYQCDIDSFFIINTNGTDGSGKGEGIFLNTRLLNGRGKAANGGGGGNSVNSGGAGGGNGGQGGDGGKEWAGCNTNFINGGIGGSYLNYNTAYNKIYLGGGGGSGHMNDFQLPGGGNGGGIAIIKTNYLKSNSFKIKSDGDTPIHIIGPADDGRSGGGAGGTILINYGNLIDNATVSAKGGDGDNCIAIPDWFHGPGGGGGGGIIWTNKPANDPLLTTNRSGGIPGTNINIGVNAWGATHGQNGSTLFNLSMPVANIPFVPGSISSFLAITICQGLNHGGYTTSGTYIDTLISVNGCDSIRTLILTVKAASYSAIAQSICSGQTYSGYSVSGTYVDTLVSASGCDSVRTINLTVKPRSFSTISQSVCRGQSFAGYTASGTYIDTLVAANGCDSLSTIHLTVLPVIQPYLGGDTILCTGDSLRLYPGPFNSYDWQNGSTQNNITVKQGGLYSVTVTDNCHSARDEILITENACDIYFPSAFTPNNDGKNDWFKILGVYNFKEYHLVVYNRWGQKVFDTFDLAKGWNGSFNGQLQPSAIFVWFCEFKKTANTNKTKMKGTVTLIR